MPVILYMPTKLSNHSCYDPGTKALTRGRSHAWAAGLYPTKN